MSFDAPTAIQSVNREQIRTEGPQVSLSETLHRVPGLTILERQNYALDLQASIRGFGARSAFGVTYTRLWNQSHTPSFHPSMWFGRDRFPGDWHLKYQLDPGLHP